MTCQPSKAADGAPIGVRRRPGIQLICARTVSCGNGHAITTGSSNDIDDYTSVINWHTVGGTAGADNSENKKRSGFSLPNLPFHNAGLIGLVLGWGLSCSLTQDNWLAHVAAFGLKSQSCCSPIVHAPAYFP